MFRQIGAPEIILILAVVVLLFGAKKLPELARGSGRALRIFKAETKGLIDDDDDELAERKAINPAESSPTQATQAPTQAPIQAPSAEVPPAERRPDQTS
ncbi:MAG TPA: Sec-independent protein translocase subunit TatA [Marmoricola sp.]|nr:Sec-independent protein translocase subunit TatA [Marmoricola sp.]